VSIAAAMSFVRDLFDNLSMPQGMAVPTVNAWITPPDPDPNAADTPTVYLWMLPGSEERKLGDGGTIPRNTGPGTPSGFKTASHEIGGWLLWNGYTGDDDTDILFPGYMDALCSALRTAYPMPAVLTDPWTGAVTNLVDLGEKITWDSPPPRALADEQYLRYDAMIRIPFCELIQA
jgi:hypothetical protein